MRYRPLLFLIPLGLCLAAYGCTTRTRQPDAVVEPTLSSIQQQIFNGSCTAPSCHGSGMKGGLSLIDGKSYAQLIGVRSAFDKKGTSPSLRVKPGSPDSSFLFTKITAPDTSQGELMPKGFDKLTQNQIEAIRQWIVKGAPDD